MDVKTDLDHERPCALSSAIQVSCDPFLPLNLRRTPAVQSGNLWLFDSIVKPAASLPRGTKQTRSSADADNGLDAFVGQSRSTNILGPFQVK